jgi:multimeric flavodoxin WrbA
LYSSPVYGKAMTAIMKRFMERSMAVLYMGKAGPVLRNAVDKNKADVVLESCGTPFPVNIIQGIAKYPVQILGMFCKAFGCEKVNRSSLSRRCFPTFFYLNRNVG